MNSEQYWIHGTGAANMDACGTFQVIPPVHPKENVTSSAPIESAPTKPCCHSRPVNGVVNR